MSLVATELIFFFAIEIHHTLDQIRSWNLRLLTLLCCMRSVPVKRSKVLELH